MAYPVDRNFRYHPPKDDQPQRYEELRQKGRELAHLIATHCPECRETSLAMTKLEESIMWANASIGRNE